MQLILIPFLHSSGVTDLIIPIMQDLDVEYVNGARPPITPVTLAVHKMEPVCRGIITRAACLIPATTPPTLIAMTRLNAPRSRSMMLGGVLHAMP